MGEQQSTALEKEMDSDQKRNCHSAGFGIPFLFFYLRVSVKQNEVQKNIDISSAY